jgi:hypothetical protein
LSVLADGLREAATNRSVLFVILLSASLFSIPEAFEEFFGPVVYEKGFSRSGTALCLGAIYVAQVLAQSLAHRAQTAPVNALLFGSALAGSFLLIPAWSASWGGPVGLALYYGLSSAFPVLFQGRLQHAIQGTARATVTSVTESSAEIIQVGTFLAIGGLAELRTMASGVFLVALVTIGLSIVFMGLAYRWRID